MRFALSDSEDEGYTSYEYTSDEYQSGGESSTKATSQPRTALGRSIRAYIDNDTSDEDEEEIDSEDEVEMIGDLGESANWTAIRQTKTRVRPVVAESSKAPWRRITQTRSLQVAVEEPNQYEGWLKSSEEQSMRDGHKSAHERRGTLREINLNAREEHLARERARAAEEEADMTRMLQAMAIKQTQDEQELAKRFAQREKQLWADIDAAIQAVERQEQERLAAIEAEKKKKQEEEAARAAEKEKEAKARREEAERLAKEHAQNEQRRKEDEEKRKADEERKRKEAEAKAIAEDKQREDKGRTAAEWRQWVDKQRWVKSEVIEPVKGDRPTRTSLRTGMRLMTRGLGQVVNTKESVLRVTADLHKILCEQLPSEPSASNPVTLEAAPKPYAYLLSHMSKGLIKQAESEVSANTDAAYPLGRVIVGLLLRGHAGFGEVLYARFVKKCPWVVPFYPSRGPDQPRDEYEKSTGRGVDESLGDYIGRMTGILTLYFAIIQTPIDSLVPTLPAPPTPEQLVTLVTLPLRFTAAWSWLAHSLRDPLPGMPPIAGMVLRWIEMLGAEAARLWGHRQVGKIFVALQTEGLDGGKIKGDSESTRQQLSMRLGSLSDLSVPPGRQWEL